MFLPSTFFSLVAGWLLGLGPQSGGYRGPPGIFGDRGAGHTRASGRWLPC